MRPGVLTPKTDPRSTMVRTLLLLSLLMAALVVAGILFLEPADLPPATSGPGPTQPTAEADGRRSLEREADPQAAAVDPATRRDVDTPKPATPDPSPSGDAAAFDGHALRVVRAEDSQPLAGAAVWFVDLDALRDRPIRVDDSASVAAQFERLEEIGTRCADSDANGTTHLPTGGEGAAVVAARHVAVDGSIRTGWQRVRMRPGSPLQLELATANSLTVRVTSADGSPVPEAPLRLTIHERNHWRSAWSGQTGADGTLTLDGVLTRCLAVHYDDDTVTEAALGLDLLLAEPVFVRFDPTVPPTEPLDLVMPPTGKVTVVVDSLEQAESRVTLARRSPLVELDPIAQDVYALTVDGRAHFEAVGLGLGLDVAAEHHNANEATEVEADGPRAPGQEVEIRVRMFGDTPVLRARLVDEDSQPITETSIGVVAKASRENSSSQSYLSIRTDTDGVVLFEPSDDLGPDATRNMAFRAEDRDLHAAVDVPTPLRPGINDLGTLTMTPPPLLLAGRVVDARGEPIQNAEVELEGKVVFDPDEVDSFYWDRIQGGEARSDADGRFSISGATESALLRASVEADGYVPANSGEVPLGVRDLLVTMQQAGGLRGEVSLPATDAPIHLQLEVVHGSSGARTDAPSLGGSFRFPSLEPGTVSLALRLYGFPGPVATRSDLRIVGGETTDVGTIDLTDTLHTIAFTVVDAQGNPIPDAVALIESEPPPGHPRRNFEGLEVAHGAGRILAASDTVDLFVYADGFRSTHHRGLRDGGEVVLPRAPEVVLQVAPDACPAGTEHRLEARLTRLEDPWTTEVGYSVRGVRGSSSMRGSRPWDQRLHADADPQGAARLELPEPGRYEVHWRLHSQGPEGTRTTGVGAPQRIEIVDTATPQQIRASLTRAQLEAALQGG